MSDERHTSPSAESSSAAAAAASALDDSQFAAVAALPVPSPIREPLDWTRLGLGTYRVRGDACFHAVRAALALGYRRVDSARVYRNEEAVGWALRRSGVPRALVHVTSKVGPHDVHSEASAGECVRRSLAALQLEAIDLYLLHWPGRGGLSPSDPSHASHRVAAWRGLVEAQRRGLVRRIGVSNFEVRHLESLEAADPPVPLPAVNQVELHPLLWSTQRPLLDYCRERGIDVQAYSPLGAGERTLLEHPTVVSIATAVGRTPAQVLLRWGVQHGVEVLPRSRDEKRLEENARALQSDWHLSEEHMATLDDMEQRYGTKRFCWDPSVVA